MRAVHVTLRQAGLHHRAVTSQRRDLHHQRLFVVLRGHCGDRSPIRNALVSAEDGFVPLPLRPAPRPATSTATTTTSGIGRQLLTGLLEHLLRILSRTHHPNHHVVGFGRGIQQQSGIETKPAKTSCCSSVIGTATNSGSGRRRPPTAAAPACPRLDVSGRRWTDQVHSAAEIGSAADAPATTSGDGHCR